MAVEDGRVNRRQAKGLSLIGGSKKRVRGLGEELDHGLSHGGLSCGSWSHGEQN